MSTRSDGASRSAGHIHPVQRSAAMAAHASRRSHARQYASSWRRVTASRSSGGSWAASRSRDAAGGGGDGVLAARRGPALEGLGRCWPPRARSRARGAACAPGRGSRRRGRPRRSRPPRGRRRRRGRPRRAARSAAIRSASSTYFSSDSALNELSMPAAWKRKWAPANTAAERPAADSASARPSTACASVTAAPARTGRPQRCASCAVATRQARELGRAEQRGAGAQRGHRGQAAVDERRALARRPAPSTSAASTSACCTASTPASVAGPVVPPITQAVMHTGCPSRAQRSRMRAVSPEICSGEVGVEDDEGARALVPVRAEEDLVDALGVVDVLVDRGDPLDGLVARDQARVRAAAGADVLGQVERLHAVAVEVDGRQLVAELGRRVQVGQACRGASCGPRACRRRRSPSRRRGRRRRRAAGRARDGGRRARTTRARWPAPPAPTPSSR